MIERHYFRDQVRHTCHSLGCAVVCPMFGSTRFVYHSHPLRFMAELERAIRLCSSPKRVCLPCQLIKSYDFNFGFCIPNSQNSWEAIYDVPPLPDDLSECARGWPLACEFEMKMSPS